MTSTLKHPELTTNYTRDMEQHSYQEQRPVTSTEHYPTPESVPLNDSMSISEEKEASTESTSNDKARFGHGRINTKHTIKNKKKSGTKKHKSKHSSELEQLLEDASRYDPSCEYSLPTTYKRSGSIRHYYEDSIQSSELTKEEDSVSNEYNDTTMERQQKSKHKKRRLIRASELLDRESSFENVSSETASITSDLKESNSLEEEVKLLKPFPKRPKKLLENKLPKGPRSPLKLEEISEEVTSLPTKHGRTQKLNTSPLKSPVKSGGRNTPSSPSKSLDNSRNNPSSPFKDSRGRKTNKQNTTTKNKSTSPVKGSKAKNIASKMPALNKSLSTPTTASRIKEKSHFRETHSDAEEKTAVNSPTPHTIKTEEEDDDISTFVDWDGPMFDISSTFFDIDSLEKTNFFCGEITDSTVISNHNNLHNAKTNHLIANSQKNKRTSYKDIFIKVKNPLFFNQSESFAINFSRDVSRYNPMLEIGKIIEYVALVYLPDPYATLLKLDIILALNEAYDNSNTDLFIKMVDKYNRFIETVPRSEIISHLKDLKQVPLSFIHDFLQTVYIRAIHPRASELKHYEAFSNYVYGELLPSFLSKVYNQCNLNQSSIFLDLGSGVGNCVIQASLEYNCKLSAGCEIMKEASDLTECQYKELQERCKLMGLTLMPIKYFLRESFVDHKGVQEVIKDCDVLLINNFLFDMELNKEVEKLIQGAKVGCKIISLKSLRAPGYAVDFYNTDNIMSRLKIEKFKFDEDSVSWTHSGGEYYISTVLDVIDESLLDISNRFRRSRQPVKYSR